MLIAAAVAVWILPVVAPRPASCDTVTRTDHAQHRVRRADEVRRRLRQGQFHARSVHRMGRTRVRDYAGRISEPGCRKANTAADLAGRLADLVPRYRANPDDRRHPGIRRTRDRIRECDQPTGIRLPSGGLGFHPNPGSRTDQFTVIQEASPLSGSADAFLRRMRLICRAASTARNSDGERLKVAFRDPVAFADGLTRCGPGFVDEWRITANVTTDKTEHVGTRQTPGKGKRIARSMPPRRRTTGWGSGPIASYRSRSGRRFQRVGVLIAFATAPSASPQATATRTTPARPDSRASGINANGSRSQPSASTWGPMSS